MHYQGPLLLCPAEAAALSLIQRHQWRRQTHIIRAKDSQYRSAVGGNSGHSALLWGIEEHVKKIEAIHSNNSGVDADAVVLRLRVSYGWPRRVCFLHRRR